MKKLRQRAPRPQVHSLKHIFKYAERGAPGLHDYQMDELIDSRALRPGEKEGVFTLLRNRNGMEWDNGQNEERVAAAYICMRLGLQEAVDIIERELRKGVESPHVSFMFDFALKSFQVSDEFGTSIAPEEQLLRLLEMRNSGLPGERKLAGIVMERAGIKYGTLVSW